MYGIVRNPQANRVRDWRLAKAAAGRKAAGGHPVGYAATGKGREGDAGPVEEGLAARTMRSPQRSTQKATSRATGRLQPFAMSRCGEIAG